MQFRAHKRNDKKFIFFSEFFLFRANYCNQIFLCQNCTKWPLLLKVAVFFFIFADLILRAYAPNSQWEVVRMSAEKSTRNRFSGRETVFPILRYTIYMKRRSTFFINTLIVPCSLLTGILRMLCYISIKLRFQDCVHVVS